MKTLLHRPATADNRGWTARPRPVVGRRGVVAFLVIALAGGLFVSVPPPNVSADALSDAYAQQKQLQKQIAAEKARIAALTSSQSSLSRRISNTRQTLGSVVDNLTQVRVDIVEMTVDVARQQQAVDELVATVAQLDGQLADLEQQSQAKAAELMTRRALLAERLRTAYDTDRTSLLETVLSSGDFTDVISEVGYHLDFAEQDKALADQIVQDQQVLAVLQQSTELAREQAATMRAAADQQKAALDSQLSDLRDAKAQLQKLQNQYQSLLAAQQSQYRQLASNKTQAQAALARMMAAKKKLEELITKLELAALRAGGIPSQYSGSLNWPMSGIITQPFGCTGFYLEPSYGNCAHFHRGIDIATTAGTPIRAAGPGKVIFAGRASDGRTYIVVVAHSIHLLTEYWHVQSRIPVRVGQYVNGGQVIAYEGCTGWCTGPHLHWVVKVVNPNGGTCGGISCPYLNPRLFL